MLGWRGLAKKYKNTAKIHLLHHACCSHNKDPPSRYLLLRCKVTIIFFFLDAPRSALPEQENAFCHVFAVIVQAATKMERVANTYTEEKH
jgi:hypothetical protein